MISPSPNPTRAAAPRWTREQIRAARVAPLVPLLQQRGLALRELAPGISAETDVLPQMAFAPEVAVVRPMPAACFAPD